MRARDGEAAVSEIVGALLLVLVVSSAAFGFGVFLHQQAKVTQAQQAAELAVKLEKLTLAGIVPSAFAYDAGCPAIPSDDSWHALTVTVTSLHLTQSTLAGIRLNQGMVRIATLVADTRTVPDAATTAGSAVVTSAGNRFQAGDLGQAITGPGIPLGASIASVAGPGSVTLTLQATATATVSASVGGAVRDFSLPTQEDPTLPGYNPELVVPPRQSAKLVLANLAMDPANCPADTTAPFALFEGKPASGSPGPVRQGDPLVVEAVTELSNRVEAAFVPPLALPSLEPTPGVATSYTLVGTGSQAGSEGAFLVKWEWRIRVDAPCDNLGVPDLVGHRALYTVASGTHTYCVRLTVTDSNGLAGSADFSFTATAP